MVAKNVGSGGRFLFLFSKVLYSMRLHLPPSESPVSEDAGIEPGPVVNFPLEVSRSNHLARFHPLYEI